MFEPSATAPVGAVKFNRGCASESTVAVTSPSRTLIVLPKAAPAHVDRDDNVDEAVLRERRRKQVRSIGENRLALWV